MFLYNIKQNLQCVIDYITLCYLVDNKMGREEERSQTNRGRVKQFVLISVYVRLQFALRSDVALTLPSRIEPKDPNNLAQFSDMGKHKQII